MFQKIKVLFVILLFGYLGYLGWRYFADGKIPSGRELISKPTPTPSASPEDKLSPEEQQAQDKKIASISILQQIKLELNQVTQSIFAPLSAGTNSQSGKLKQLWDRSESEFKSGNIEQADAKRLAQLISSLIAFSKERGLYVERLQQVDKTKASTFSTSASEITTGEKKAFAKKEVNRQWQDWVQINRYKTQELLQTLSK